MDEKENETKATDETPNDEARHEQEEEVDSLFSVELKEGLLTFTVVRLEFDCFIVNIYKRHLYIDLR